MEIVVTVILNIILFVVTCVIPFLYVLRSRKWLRGIFLGWGLGIISSFIVSVPLFAIVYYYNKDLAVKSFPEAISVVALLFLGWLPASVISFVAVLTRFAIRHFWPFVFSDNAEKDIVFKRGRIENDAGNDGRAGQIY
jgi:hypothetical protein